MPYMKKAVKPPRDSDCFFCDYARAPRSDRKNLVLLRGKTGFVVLNRYPYTGGHLLIAPLAHKGELGSLSTDERSELFELLVRTEASLRKSFRPQGFNIGLNLGRAAGAGVPGHLHFHLVPRWVGDVNFMTSVSDVRVIPQALEETYDRLQKTLRNGR
jgi:ATP adenylyltransferase